MEEICPECGAWTDHLIDWSGWCRSCSASFYRAEDKDSHLCPKCGKTVMSNAGRVLCWDCKQEAWLVEYGDYVERAMLSGHSFGSAKKLIANLARPVCRSCGGPIKGGKPGKSLFCGSEECKKVRREYDKLRAIGLDQESALDEVRKEKR